MTAVQDASQILKQIPEIKNVFPWRIPPNKQTITNTTDALITDVLTKNIHGSNRTEEFSETIAVNIFLGKNVQISIDTLTKTIITKFEQAGWTTLSIGETTIDPDTDQFSKTFQFTERKYI